MKKIALLLVFGTILITRLFSQPAVYTTSGGEMIFSFATIEDNGNEKSSIIRWAPVFNFQSMLNVDFTNYVGIFSGLAIRNVGYIYDGYTEPETGDEVKKKFRTYNAGIPIGLKLGNLNKTFIYGGYEFEFPLHYKEKTFKNEKKDKFGVWFSDRVETFQHAFMIGFQFKYGGNLKFKYYLSSFHNKDYTELVDGVEIKPYEFLDANVFYFSLNFNLFKNAKINYPGKDKPDGV